MSRLVLVLVALARRPNAGLAVALVATIALADGMAAAQSVPEHTIPTAGSRPLGITAGPDGNLWFTEDGKIGKVTTTALSPSTPSPPAASRPTSPLAPTATSGSPCPFPPRTAVRTGSAR